MKTGTQSNKQTRLAKSHARMVAALAAVFKHCALVHRYWGEGDNAKLADAAEIEAKAALAEAQTLR